MCKLHESQNTKYLKNDSRRDTITTITCYGKENRHCVLFTDHEYAKEQDVQKRQTRGCYHS